MSISFFSIAINLHERLFIVRCREINTMAIQQQILNFYAHLTAQCSGSFLSWSLKALIFQSTEGTKVA